MTKKPAILTNKTIGSSMKKASPESTQKSAGTIIAEAARARLNGISDQKRHDLMEEGMAIIYGGSGHAKTNSGRR